LHIQRKIWKGHTRNAIWWAFYCANDVKEGDPRNPQLMRCQFCYNSHVHAFNLNTKERERLRTYYNTYGLTTFIKHVDSDHATIVKKIEEKVKLVKGLIQRKFAKTRMNVSRSAISQFFSIKDPFQKDDE
jgi:hypothetical protein